MVRRADKTQVDSAADERIQYIHESGARQIFGTLPGSHIVDILLILDRLPLWLKPWERSARAQFLRDLQWCRNHMVQVQKEDNPHNNFSMLKNESLRTRSAWVSLATTRPLSLAFS